MISFRSLLRASLLALICVVPLVAAAADQAPAIAFDLPASAAAKALKQFSAQSGRQLIYSSADVAGVTTNEVKGTFTAEEALTQLLQGTPLAVTRSAHDGSIAVGRGKVPDPKVERAAVEKNVRPEKNENRQETAKNEEDPYNLDTFEVFGRKSLNMDIRRTSNDPLPYVTFGQEDIARSGVSNVDDFLRTRLAMNSARTSMNQFETTTTEGGTSGAVDLRGLGTNQTLILVDGRRLPSSPLFDPAQPNISGIPLASIERIEVLPAGAGAIYGGGATAGVVNIILKRHYQGGEIKATYGNTFDRKTGDYNISLTSGFTLKDGRTRVMLAASKARDGGLNIADRNSLLRRARALTLARTPTVLQPGTSLAVGATPNISSATVNGAGTNATVNNNPLLLDNGTSLGSSITHLSPGHAGPSTDNAASLVANAGSYNLDAPLLGQDLLSRRNAESVTVNVRREFGERLEIYTDFAADRQDWLTNRNYTTQVFLRGSNPLNPFQNDILIQYGPVPGLAVTSAQKSTMTRFTLGAIFKLPFDWMATTEFTGGQSGAGFTSSPSSPFVTGYIPVLGGVFGLTDLNAHPVAVPLAWRAPSPSYFSDSTLRREGISLRVGGPIVQLPAGPATLNALVERQTEKMAEYRQTSISAAVTPPSVSYTTYPAAKVSATSFYTEVLVPVVSPANKIPAVTEIEMQASVRREEQQLVSNQSPFVDTVPNAPHAPVNYSTTRFNKDSVLLATKYSPVEGLTFRASYSTAFLPPRLSQVSLQSPALNSAAAFSVTDPRRGNTALVGDASGQILVNAGGNPKLKPEESTTRALGIIIQPKAFGSLRLSVDYVQIRKTNEINSPTVQNIIDLESQFPGRVTRGLNRPGDLAGWAGPITGLDYSLINLFHTQVTALDFQASYEIKTKNAGTFSVFGSATRQKERAQQTLYGAPSVDSLGFSDGPLAWKGNGGLTWARGPLTLGWNAQYYHHYLVYSSFASASSITTTVNRQGSDHIPSQMYHDVFASYRFQGDNHWLGHSTVSVGVQNVLGKNPPPLAVVSGNTTISTYSTYADPRLRRFTVSFSREF